jgi:hypothetical protein
MNLARFAILIACLVVAGTVEERASRAPPLPDSAVGQHRPVKPARRGNWVVIRVQGRSGWWRCYIPAGYKWPRPGDVQEDRQACLAPG